MVVLVLASFFLHLNCTALAASWDAAFMYHAGQ